MQNSAASRYQFIAHALNGDGPFRPVVSHDAHGQPITVQSSYLVRYPRESDEKFSRRNEVAFFDSPMAQAAGDFVGYLSERNPVRNLPHTLYKTIADDADGKGNSVDVFWQAFMIEAKARGCMCLLVDMPAMGAKTMGEQIIGRVAPYLAAIKPEQITEYEIGQDGKFVFAEFAGRYIKDDGERVDASWRFDRFGWEVRAIKGGAILDAGEHPLDQCPILIFTEGGDFPAFGPFAPIADLSKRLFNLDSELDEILRAQTFSLLTMQVPEGSTDSQKIDAARVVGETLGTANLMVHTGSTPTFIAPDAGPAATYAARIDAIRARINEIGLAIASPSQRESGISMQMRFHKINAALAKFASQMEDLERRAWDLCRQWLGMSVAPEVQWSRDYSLADAATELEVLASMQATAMPQAVIAAQQKRIVAVQFSGADQEEQDVIYAAIDERAQEVA
jgi:hypothetical protein